MLVVLYILIITGIPGAILSIPVMKYLREMKASQKGTATRGHAM